MYVQRAYTRTQIFPKCLPAAISREGGEAAGGWAWGWRHFWWFRGREEDGAAVVVDINPSGGVS